MKTKIIELQNNIKALHKEIADLEKLAADNDISQSTVNATLNDLIEQKNDLLISEGIGADKKTELANVEKLIKAARNELEKNNEKARFVEAIQKRIHQKHENLSVLKTRHQDFVTDYLREMTDKKAKEKEILLESFLESVFAIEALNEISRFLPARRSEELCAVAAYNIGLISVLRDNEVIENQKIVGGISKKESEIRAFLDSNKIELLTA